MQKYTSAREAPNYGYAAQAARVTLPSRAGYAAQPAGYGYAAAPPQGYRQQGYVAPNAAYAAPGVTATPHSPKRVMPRGPAPGMPPSPRATATPSRSGRPTPPSLRLSG
jgi:hypothetical protein